MYNIKKNIKNMIGYKKVNYLRFLKNTYKNNRKSGEVNFIKLLLNTRVLPSYKELFDKVKLNDNYNNNFYYSIDKYKTFLYKGDVIANLTIDYERILNNSLDDFKNNIEDDSFSNYEKECIEGIENLLEREIKLVSAEDIKDSLRGIKNRKATTFKDCLQRILFYNQLMWQTGHYLNGLGRLDFILNPYYENDIKNNIISKDEAKQLLKEVLENLHKDYYFKSNSLSGDTGQIIILGGYDKDKNYICNDLTYMFIELMEELQLPDPKVLLRVAKDTPRELIEISIKCIKTGIGCPLFANDDIIIPKLIEFGFDKDDAYNYGTAACWEPFMIGKSFDQNNLKSISFMDPFNTMINNIKLEDIRNVEELKEEYKKSLSLYLDDFIKETNSRKFGHDPLLSLLTDNCMQNKKDISEGGAKYNNYGFTGVGLSNLINSFVVLNDLVFEKKRYSLDEFNNIRENNFENEEELLKNIKNEKEKYGTDNLKVIELTNEIIRYTTKILAKKNNPLGGKYKFGLSAPSYIDASKDFPASFDGRKNGEPFGVHISSDTDNAYTELIQFASKLDYGENRFNGNVIDFIVSPSFIEDNFDKFVDFIILSIKLGFFEMQMNVVSSQTLIEARANPDKFPNLIVRVWGFSSYFNDLPDEYKDYLIERALKSEGNSY